MAKVKTMKGLEKYKKPTCEVLACSSLLNDNDGNVPATSTPINPEDVAAKEQPFVEETPTNPWEE